MFRAYNVIEGLGHGEEGELVRVELGVVVGTMGT